MRAYEDRSYAPQRPSIPWLGSGFAVLLVALVFVVAVMGVYNECKIEVGTGEQAVLIRKVGLDLAPDMELSPPQTASGTYYKGVHPRPLTEGRYFYNPYYWAWEIDKQFLVPDG
jgi:hypothetical protein